tara:strand:- start:1117 stop:1434 length:318 start_codon:yes stop_codon:yes gene_type:complete
VLPVLYFASKRALVSLYGGFDHRVNYIPVWRVNVRGNVRRDPGLPELVPQRLRLPAHIRQRVAVDAAFPQRLPDWSNNPRHLQRLLTRLLFRDAQEFFPGVVPFM